MERIITNLDHGWWIISHEQKIWLPKGELPHGFSQTFQLEGATGRQIGEWEGEPVWLVRENRHQDMGSVRQIIDQDAGLFQLAGRGVQLAEFYRSHKFCGYCGHTMHASKSEWAMLFPLVVTYSKVSSNFPKPHKSYHVTTSGSHAFM